MTGKKPSAAPVPSVPARRARRLALTVDTVVLTVREGVVQVLLVRRGSKHHRGEWALPGGFVGAEEALDAAAERELAEETGLRLDPSHVEQLRAYGVPERDDRADRRVVAVAFLAIQPELPDPIAGTDAAEAAWEPVAAVLDGRFRLAFDHATIVGDAVTRVREAIGHTALATAFCPEEFTEAQLRAVYEAVWDVGADVVAAGLDAPNFHRSLSNLNPPMVERVPDKWASTGGRPAAVYRKSEHVRAFGPAAQLERPITKPRLNVAKRRLH